MNNRYREEEMNECKNNELENENLNNCEEKLSRKEKKTLKTIEELKEEIEKLENDLKSANEKYLMTLAETENFRKRIEEEKIRDRKYASQRLLEKLVNSIDIFDKACNMQTDNDVLKNFLIGFQMIFNQIQNTLEEEGVKKIKTNTLFDPRYHHAMETDYDETKEEGAILAVLKDGYMYKDRVLVAALVKVNKKPEQKDNEDSSLNENKEN